MAEKLLPVETILTRLAEGPPRIAGAAAGLTQVQLITAPRAGEWSANEVLAHLRSCGDVWGDYIGRILAQDNPTIRAVSPRTWIAKTDYREQDFQASFQMFANQRGELMRVLKGLAPNDWARRATVTGVGAPLERTVWNYADRMAVHERSHLKQVERICDELRA